jgi:hypothetical protein
VGKERSERERRKKVGKETGREKEREKINLRLGNYGGSVPAFQLRMQTADHFAHLLIDGANFVFPEGYVWVTCKSKACR